VTLAELGANDPNFSLRREPALIYSGPRSKNFAAVTVFEPHGEYNPTDEYTLASRSQVKHVSHISGETTDYIEIELKSGESLSIGLSTNASADAKNQIDVKGQAMSWTGPYALIETKEEK